jgi:exopolysaccharide biosynthesis protein
VNETADLKNVWTAVSGFGIILSDGNNVGDSKTIHPRTAAGLSRDNRYLFLMVIDGRQAGYSEGATLYETAEWLKSFGAYNGLNLDGGGSSSLVRSDGSGGAIILNRPIHLGIVGKERIVGNNLGVLITSKKQTDKN